MITEMRHEARQVPSWLIFDVSQKMQLADSGVALDFPPEWKRFSERGRLIFQSPQREEIVVSVSRLISTKEGEAVAPVLARMVENGLDAARKAAASPDLRITKALSEEAHSKMRCWTMFSETHARDIFFGQAVLAHSRGVVLLTYEAPFTAGADKGFHHVLGSVGLI